MKHSKLEKILENYPTTRGNDKLLFIKYLQDFHCETEVEKAIIEKVILQAPTQATLQRSRAWYQNELGMYLPGLGVVNKRKEKAIEFRNKVRQAKKQDGLFDGLHRFFNKLTK